MPLSISAFAENSPAVKPAAAPATQIPLAPLGYKPGTSLVGPRSSHAVATIHFIDKEHLLLTYSTRALIKRLEDQRETDEDHMVRALVLHLPDGKILREAQWRLHDRAQYLWPLPQGHFLLRIRNNLYSLDPLGSRDPLHLGQHLLLEQEATLESIFFSPSRDLLLLETSPPQMIGDDPADVANRPVTANFFGIQVPPDGTVHFVHRGQAKAKNAFSMSFTSMGVLETVKEDRTHWGFDFHIFSGRKLPLAGFTSTCRPHAIFVSDAEFFAYGCRGGDEQKLMGGFNLLSDAKWVFTTDDEPVWLSVQSSPETGRFAVRNTQTTAAAQPDSGFPIEVQSQEVCVYGDHDGEELLRVKAFPAQRPDGNFALSPDGLQLAVLQGDQLALYALPPISKADHAFHQKEQGILSSMRSATQEDVVRAISTADNNDN